MDRKRGGVGMGVIQRAGRDEMAHGLHAFLQAALLGGIGLQTVGG